MPEGRKPKDAMERLLQRSLEKGLGASGENCPEPGILAAYFDREMSAEDRRRWDQHVSQCVRCQEQLALLVRTEPLAADVPASKPLRLRFWGWRWAGTLATAAAVVALWIAVRPETQLRPPNAMPEARVASRPAVTPPPTEPATLAKQEAAPPRQAPEKLQARIPTYPPAAGTAGRAPASPAAPVAATRTADPVAALASRTDSQAQRPEDLPIARDQAITESRVEAPRERAMAAGKAEQKVPAAPQTVSREAGTSEWAADERDKKAPARTTELSTARRAPTTGGTLRSTTSAGPEVRIAAPGGKFLWRVAGTGWLERSQDAGSTWVAKFVPEHPLTAGVCPAEKVCWMVGRSGTVLRTTDGERWERLGFPVDVDLVGVEGHSAAEAVVITGSGTRYLTADGGRTWKPVP